MKNKNYQKEKRSLNTFQETDDDRLNIKYQDKEYNESYKKWRRENKDSLGFFFVEKPDRIAYRDGVGFINDHPEIQEERSIRKAINILGAILIFRSLFDILSVYVIPFLLEKIGADIRYDFFEKKYYGNETLIINIQFMLNILSMVLPVGFLTGHLHMPIKVMLPTRISNKPMFFASVPIMLLICGVCSAMSMLYEHLLAALRIDTSRTLFFPDDAKGIILMAAANIIIIPTISELCTRGVILQFTRQFGDGIAIIITSIITSSMCYDITQFCFIFIASVAIGYFTIRTGSVLTAVVMRITMSLFGYTLYYFDYIRNSYLPIMLVVFLAIIIGFVFAIIFLYKYSDRFGMKISSRYMTYDKKMLAFFTSAPIIIWLTLNFIITLMNIKFL